MKKTRPNVTITDVAKLAGVSVGTVSRVLNGAENTGLEVRNRVQEAVKALEYVPNHVARSLKRRETSQIALVVPNIANPVYVQMAIGVQRESFARGYHVTLVSTDGDSAYERRALESLEQRYVDGTILCSLNVTDALVRKVARMAARVCVIGSLPLDSPVDNVRVDSDHGVHIGLEHLHEGHRSRVAFVNGTSGTVPARVRGAAYRKALAALGLAYDPDLVAEADFSIDGGYRAVTRILERTEDVDAFFCANDAMALGALRRLREMGIRIPSDVAVVGMDDIDFARMTSPTLTSVSLLARERGRLAAELLLDRLAEDDVEREARKVAVTPRLIVRESSASR